MECTLNIIIQIYYNFLNHEREIFINSVHHLYSFSKKKSSYVWFIKREIVLALYNSDYFLVEKILILLPFCHAKFPFWHFILLNQFQYRTRITWRKKETSLKLNAAGLTDRKWAETNESHSYWSHHQQPKTGLSNKKVCKNSDYIWEYLLGAAHCERNILKAMSGPKEPFNCLRLWNSLLAQQHF